MVRAILVATILLGVVALPWASMLQLSSVRAPPWLATPPWISIPQWISLPQSSSIVTTKLSSALAQVSAILPQPEIPNNLTYRTEAVHRGDIVTAVDAAGTLNAVVLVDVGSQVSGLVKELYVDFNSKVTEGQVIARVEPEAYEVRVAQARADLEMAEAQVQVQRAQIEKTRAELEAAIAQRGSAEADTLRGEVALSEAAQEVARKHPLAERNVISTAEWERVQNAHQSAEAEAAASRADELSRVAAVKAAQAALSMAEAQLANTLAQVKQKQALLHQAQIDLGRTFIRAPVTGTVVNRAVSGGQTLAASLQTPTLFTIAQDLKQMQVEASVVEADIGRFAVGQPVTFTVDAYPERTFAGTVKQIRKAPQLVQNVVTYVAIITTENPDELLLPGMTANLRVVTGGREAVLKVPNAALRYRPAGEGIDGAAALTSTPTDLPRQEGLEPGTPGRVFVPGPDGGPKAVALRLGITDGRMTEVVAGELTEGQRVIIGVAGPPEGDSDASSVLVRFRLR